MHTMTIERIGFASPGLPDWQSARGVLSGAHPWPEPGMPVRAEALPRTERRRATDMVHVAVAAAAQASGHGAEAPDPAMPAVFACSEGDMYTLEHICRSLAESVPWVSPHRFHNSVHNAPAGYWSIATGCRGPNTSLSAGEESVGAGLVEALGLLIAEHRPRALLVAYDQAAPTVLRNVCAIDTTLASALLIGRKGQQGRRVGVAFEPSAEPTRCADPALEHIRCINPAARLLPLLIALVRPHATQVVLGRPNGSIRVEIEPEAA